MKKIICLTLAMALTGCSSSKMIDGKRYGTYGLFNESTQKNDKITYEANVGDVILSVVFFETVFVPVFLIGFDLFEPIGKVGDQNNKGVIN